MRDNESIRNVSGMLVFLAVAREGGFSAAARRLGLSKASVSREVAALEQRLGAQLLRRTTRRMSVTEVGQLFLERCERVAEEVEAAELSVSQLQASPRGEVRLAAPMSFGHLQLAPRLPDFLSRHPEVRLDVDLTDRIIDLVHERIDLSLRIGRPPSEQTHVLRRLCPIRALVCASPRYFERHGCPEDPEALRDHACLGYARPPEMWNFSGKRQVPTSGPLNADNADALRQAALADLGIVYLPTFVIGDDVRAGRLVPILSEHIDFVASAYAVYPGSRHVSPKVRAVIDWLAEVLGPEPDWDAGLPDLPGAS
jgi:DNA-binding transcriptional LysR family regulator